MIVSSHIIGGRNNLPFMIPCTLFARLIMFPSFSWYQYMAWSTYPAFGKKFAPFSRNIWISFMFSPPPCIFRAWCAIIWTVSSFIAASFHRKTMKLWSLKIHHTFKNIKYIILRKTGKMHILCASHSCDLYNPVMIVSNNVHGIIKGCMY